MRHYEIILLINPNQSERITNIIEELKVVVKEYFGTIHRLEDWGRRALSYKIKKIQKAHYILMNIEGTIKLIKKLENNFKFNDYILRNLIISCKKAVTEDSPILKIKENVKKELISKRSKSIKQLIK